jgi:signal transduction histidine kinase
VSLTVYRIVQEGLRNAGKHADAKGCRVEIRVEDGTVCVTVEDDGKGFDLARHPRGLGLASLTERVKLCGGDLEVQSSPGAGTRIIARMPLEWEPR